MTTYDEWLTYASKKGIRVVELPLEYCGGMIVDNIIGIDSKRTTAEKTGIISEELGHFETTVGNILNQSTVPNRKQEMKARRWSHNHQIRQQDLVEAAQYGCRNAYDVAEFLGISEEFLQEAVEDFRKQYGTATVCDDYLIVYEPYLMVIDMTEGGEEFWQAYKNEY